MATTFDGQVLKKPDAQGRISIGKEHAGETYAVQKQKNGNILLSPVTVIHKREAWLFNNREALDSVKRGISDASEGKTSDMGSFADAVGEPDEEE